jgi:hypothetical protein
MAQEIERIMKAKSGNRDVAMFAKHIGLDVKAISNGRPQNLSPSRERSLEYEHQRRQVKASIAERIKNQA